MSSSCLVDDEDKATRLLLQALGLTVDGATLDELGRKQVHDFIWQAKDEIGESIKRLQGHFEVWADPDRKKKWKESALRLRGSAT